MHHFETTRLQAHFLGYLPPCHAKCTSASHAKIYVQEWLVKNEFERENLSGLTVIAVEVNTRVGGVVELLVESTEVFPGQAGDDARVTAGVDAVGVVGEECLLTSRLEYCYYFNNRFLCIQERDYGSLSELFPGGFKHGAL
jgi:hypothetical protein